MVEAVVMYLIEASWAVVISLLVLGILYYNYQVITQFSDDAKLAATRIFLDGETDKAFKLFAFGVTCYGLTALVGVVTVSFDPEIYRLITKAGAVIMFGAWILFMRQIALVTQKPEA